MQEAESLSTARGRRTKEANYVKGTISYLSDPLKSPDKPEWRRPDGLPSWWPFWSDSLKENVRRVVSHGRYVNDREQELTMRTQRDAGTLPSGPYPWIRAWGWMMGSDRGYIEAQIARAQETHAPQDAIYENHGAGGVGLGTWSRASEISSPNTRWVLAREFGPLPEK